MKPSTTNVAFGSSDPYQSVPEIDYVKNIDVSVATPVQALISATLGDVYTELLPFRKTLEIPIGTRLVLELQWADGRVWSGPHRSSTVPKMLPVDILKRHRQVAPGKVF